MANQIIKFYIRVIMVISYFLHHSLSFTYTSPNTIFHFLISVATPRLFQDHTYWYFRETVLKGYS